MKRPAKGRKQRQQAVTDRRHAVIPAKLRGHGPKGAGLKRPAWMLTK